MKSAKRQIRGLIPDWFVLIKQHRKAHGEFPNIFRPVTFNEKILHRNLFDRRPIFTQIADKFAVRSYVEARLGPEILPTIFYLTDKPETIPFDDLPEKFAVKPTHGSAWIQIVQDKSRLDRNSLIKTCIKWLNTNYYEETRETVYRHIPPRIMIEEFIDDGSGSAPNDYKLFVFDGKVEMIQVDAGRFTDHRRRLFSCDWKKIDIIFQYKDIDGDVAEPCHLERMIAAAEALGSGFDFIRADFYSTRDRLYFGELTATPEGGAGRFTPKAYDKHLGDLWKVTHS